MRATVQQISRGGRRADWSTTARCGSNTPKRITVFSFVYNPDHPTMYPCSSITTMPLAGRRSNHALDTPGWWWRVDRWLSTTARSP